MSTSQYADRQKPKSHLLVLVVMLVLFLLLGFVLCGRNGIVLPGVLIGYAFALRKSKYVLSDFGKALKQNSLNFDDGIQGQVRLGSYNQLTPANLPSLATDEDIMKLFQ